MNMNQKADSELHETMTFFNTRQDALTAIVKLKSDVKGQLGDLHIVHIEDDEVEFAYHPPPTGHRKELKIKFDPPLQDAWGARPRLMRWRDDAYKKWGVPKHPRVYYYKVPPMFPYALPALLALAVLLFATFGEGIPAADWIREKVASNLGEGFLQYAGYFAALMHVAVEPVFMLILTHKYSTPIVPRIKWLLTNIVVGYGALDQFRECIMYERMRVIYRHTDVGDIGPSVKGANDTAAKKTQ